MGPHLLIGLGRRARSRLERELIVLRRSAGFRSARPRSLTKAGLLFCRLGKTREGLALLDKAARPGALDRAECLILGARYADAAALLGKEPAALRAHFLRAIARSKVGDRAGALADARAAIAAAPSAAAAHALLGVLLCDAGELGQGRAAFDKAASLGRGAAWTRALRSLAESAAGDWTGAKRDLDFAAAHDPGPWVLCQRAHVLDRLSFFQEALSQLRRVRRDFPESEEPHLLAARIYQDQAQYARAENALARAIRLRPGSAALLRLRASCRILRGDFRAAESDLALAVRSGGGTEAEYERLWALILQNRLKEAAAGLGRLDSGSRNAWRAPYLMGFIRSRQGRFADSVRYFSEAGGKAPEAPLRQRASYYRLIGELMADAADRAAYREQSRLLICSLGYRPPFQATVAVVRALFQCRTLYSNLSHGQAMEFLGLFPGRIHPVVFRRWRSQTSVCAREVFRGLKKGGRVGFVTRGHPLFYGDLAAKLVLRARREGVSCRVFGSVSIADILLGIAPSKPSKNALGAHVLSSKAVQKGPLPLGRFPAVVYNVGPGRARSDFQRRLKSRYPPAQPCYLLAGAGDREFIPEKVPLGGLGAALRQADEAVTLLLPSKIDA